MIESGAGALDPPEDAGDSALSVVDLAPTLTNRIGLVLLQDRTPVPLAVIAARCLAGRPAVGRRLAQLNGQRRISRAKGQKGRTSGSSRWRYYLTEAQAVAWIAAEQMLRARRAAAEGRVVELLPVDVADLPARLRFLSELLHRPGFEGNAILSACVADYKAALHSGAKKERA